MQSVMGEKVKPGIGTLKVYGEQLVSAIEKVQHQSFIHFSQDWMRQLLYHWCIIIIIIIITNYRRISLISVLGKLQERIVFKALF